MPLGNGEWLLLNVPNVLFVIQCWSAYAYRLLSMGLCIWFVTRRLQKSEFSTFVLVFDLEDEVFREIPLPKHSDTFYWKRVSILAYENSIAVIEPGYSFDTLDIWVLKNYADASSWTKIISLDAQAAPHDISRPPSGFYRAFRKSGEAILETYKKWLVSRNLETQEVKDLSIVLLILTLRV